MNRSEDFGVNITSFKDSLRTAEKVSTTLSALLTFISLCLLSTCLSKQCRAVSAVWYIYFLLVVVVFYGIVLCIGMSDTAFYITDGCLVLHSLSQMMQLSYSYAVVWINIEIFRTIIFPKESWMSAKFKRFCFGIGLTCGVNLIIVTVSGVYSSYNGCPLRIVEEIVHVFRNWIPGLVVIIMSIMNIASYIKLRRTYNQVVDSSPVVINPTEWFICIIMINSLFIFLELLYLNFSVVFLSKLGGPYGILRFIERLFILVIAYPIVILKIVRQTIVMCFRKIFNRRRQNMTVRRQDIGMANVVDDPI